MSRPVCITYDSTCDLTPALLERFQIRTVPLTIQSGQRTFPDDGSYTALDLYADYQKDGTLPKTAAVSPEEFKNFFAPILDEGFDIVHIDISSNLSCTCQNALLAATEMEAAHRIHVVDSRQLSTGGALLALQGAKLRDQGLPAAEIAEELPDGNRLVKFFYEGIFLEVLDRLGKMPLPPYIKEELQDRERYQTVYSKVNGSAAAPTAGLHFTPELLEKIRQMGVKVGYVTLHVGLGTFRPVKEEEITDHAMHSEYCVISQETADLINETKKNGGRVICVGTTSCRTVESQAAEDGTMRACAGWTDIFIYPGYRFKVMDALVTNFHLPESTLIMLVSALAGREHVLSAYKEAVEQRYRFFSFGDAMFIGNMKDDEKSK